MVTVHRRVNCVTVIKGIQFLPGMTHLSDAEFNMVKQTKAFQSEIACTNMYVRDQIETATGEAVEASESVTERSTRFAKEIESLSIPEAKKIINDLHDPRVLKAIRKNDGRKGIDEAVENRLQDIKSQKGDDLAAESRIAPEGDGSDFDSEINGSKDDIDGNKGHSAIPAMKKKSR